VLDVFPGKLGELLLHKGRGILGVSPNADAAALEIPGLLQLLHRRADAVHALLADVGKAAGGIVPILRDGFVKIKFLIFENKSAGRKICA
jgi:hypothetical protein